MEDLMLQFQGYVSMAGAWGPLVYILIMILAIVLSPIPSSPLAIFAGSFFGGFWALIWTLIGATLGAVIAFFIARRFGRPIVLKFISVENLNKMENRFSNNHLAWIVFLLRLPPLPFFDAVSYVAGLTKIKTPSFILATVFGLIPISAALTYFGQWMGDSIIGVVLIIFISGAVFFVAKKYLHRE